MKEIIEKLIGLEIAIASEKGPFDLFALFSTDEESEDRWDLVVSATWIGEEVIQALEYLNSRLRSHLTPQEFSIILKIAPLDVYDWRVRDLQKLVTTEHELKELEGYRFYGFRVQKMYVITCKPQIDERLMRSIWNIILKMWRSSKGNKIIESEAILKELQRKGKKVRDYEMDRILEYLIKAGCIRGPQYVDSSGIREHGAMSITWIDPEWRIPSSISLSA
ncbi:MAG: hypothetical protein L0229_22260 [Blastocatellia bacterium]|nr:hypothetical protein [Blastocatellia bacterium]